MQPDSGDVCCCQTEPCQYCGTCEELGPSLIVTISGITSNGCTESILHTGDTDSGEITADGFNAIFVVTGVSPSWECSLAGVGSTSTIYSEANCDQDDLLGTGAAQAPYSGNTLQVSCADGILTVLLTFDWEGSAPGLFYQWRGSGALGAAITLAFLPPTSDPSLPQALSNGIATVTYSP
jgi:hypothetical protein